MQGVQRQQIVMEFDMATWRVTDLVPFQLFLGLTIYLARY